MSKNIGWSKKFAEAMAKSCKTSEVDAYAQKEEHWTYQTEDKYSTHQWIVVLQKKEKR